MTHPNSGFVGGAIDLAQVKARAEARAKAQNSPESTSEGSPAFVVATEDNFEQEIIRRSSQVPVVVLVGTARTDASAQLKADLKTLAERGNNTFSVAYVDADATPSLAQVFGVRALPTVIALGAGTPLTNFEGAQPIDALEKWVEALVKQVGPQLAGHSGGGDQSNSGESLPDEAPVDPRLDAAMEKLNAGDFDSALALYDDILEAEPDNQEIKQARDTTKLLKRLNPRERAGDPIAEADAEPTDVEKQMLAADAEIVAGNPQGAFNRLLSVMQTQPAAKAQLRDRLLELFGMFDASDPRVLEARTKMANAFF